MDKNECIIIIFLNASFTLNGNSSSGGQRRRRRSLEAEPGGSAACGFPQGEEPIIGLISPTVDVNVAPRPDVASLEFLLIP